MKRLQPYLKTPTSLITYVPDSLKSRAQLDYITQVSNYLRSNREEHLKRLSNWKLKDIEQAIRNYSREVDNFRIHREFSMAKIFKEEIAIYKTAKVRMLKKVFLDKIKKNKYFPGWAQELFSSSRLGSGPGPLPLDFSSIRGLPHRKTEAVLSGSGKADPDVKEISNQ